jgi:hypothetical protein
MSAADENGMTAFRPQPALEAQFAASSAEISLG